MVDIDENSLIEPSVQLNRAIIDSLLSLSERVKTLEANQKGLLKVIELLLKAKGCQLEAYGIFEEEFKRIFVDNSQELTSELTPRAENEIHKGSLVILLSDLSEEIVNLDNRVNRLETLNQLPPLPKKKIKFRYEV